jgi:hypothetical protein
MLITRSTAIGKRWLSPDIEAAATLVNSGQLSELLPSFHLVEKIH